MMDADNIVKNVIKIAERNHSDKPNILDKKAMMEAAQNYALKLDSYRNYGTLTSGDLLPSLIDLTKYINILSANAEIFVCGYESQKDLYAYHLVNNKILTYHIEKI